MKTAEASALAYSYIRFSTAEQSKGDSLRRQTEAATEWCERNSVRLDTSVTYHDLGKSAYLGEHRKNPDRYALAAFLKLVQDGRIPRGSFLVIESLDRLTREHVRAGLMLLLGLIESGVRIVQLSPSELIYDERSDEMGLMLAIVELSRGHRESKRKSDLVSAAWVNKRRQARKEGKERKVVTKRVPAWIEEAGGELRLIPERAAIVRRIFSLAANGYGCTLIVKKLVADGVPAIGDSGEWVRSYVGLLLNDRRTVGEYQPRLRDRSPDGEPIPGYYPSAITEAEWLAARAGAAARHDAPGRTGIDHINVFANLLRDARTGGTYMANTRTDPAGRPDRQRGGRKGRHRRVLVTATSHDGTTPCWSFPFPEFERAILGCLREIDPCEVLGSNDQPDEAMVISGERARVISKIAELEAELLNGDVPALARVLRDLEIKKRELTAQLTAAQQKAANPLSSTWGEAKSLLATLESAPDPDDARLRLRSALRRMIESIYLLVVSHKRVRLCAVQIRFADGERCRNYLIMARPPRSNAAVKIPAESRVWSLAEIIGPDDLDLRKPKHVQALERALTNLDISALEE